MKLNYRDKVILGIVLAIAILLAGYFMLIKPKNEDIKSNKATLEDLDKVVSCNIGRASIVELEQSGEYLLRIRGIDIADFGKKIVVKGYYEDEDFALLKFTPLTWVNSAIKKAGVSDLGKAVGNYYLKAVDYFGVKA